MFSRNELTLGCRFLPPPRIAESGSWWCLKIAESYSLLIGVNCSIFIHKLCKHTLELNDTQGDWTSVFFCVVFLCKDLDWAFGAWWIFRHVSIFSEARRMQECAWEVLVWPHWPQEECGGVSSNSSPQCMFVCFCLFVFLLWGVCPTATMDSDVFQISACVDESMGRILHLSHVCSAYNSVALYLIHIAY